MLIEKFTRSIMYGGTDGIITMFNLISSIEGSKQNPLLVFFLGISILIGDALSMGFSDFLSIRSENRLKPKEERTETPHYYGLSTFISFILFGLLPLGTYLLYYAMYGKSNYIITLLSIIISLALLGYLNSYEKEIKEKIKNSIEVVLVGTFTSFCSFYVSKMLSSYFS
jgi:vacuolar iron transporter family protein